jgi:hypothetical protein
MNKSIGDAWDALAIRLEARKRELAEAVRSYPTPIARCDVQLPQAIERRDHAARDWADAREIEERMRSLAARLARDDDEVLRGASERLLAQLAAS